ncbi:hypothetical protein [Nocardioides psychrotolerans]|uniref:hypothetical protein n=1 Tax=Nocardioides psychrotolerans TaxID=1005945 RepID=UPI003137B08F
MTTRSRLGVVGVALATLLAPLGLALTTTTAEAAPSKTHHLQVYKKQAHVVLDALDPDAEFDGPALENTKKFVVACDSGDFAVDGTWTVDKVDDSNAEDGSHVAGDESLVAVTESVGRNGMGANARNRWDFSMTNLAPARAQVTAYVVCLNSTTRGGSNPDHLLTISDRFDDGTTNVTSADTAVSTSPCAANQISVANGWSNYTDPTSTPQVRRSWASSSAATSWQFTFRTVSGTAQVTRFHRCLTLKTQAATNVNAARAHAHDLFASFDPEYTSSGKVITDHAEDAVVTADCNASEAAYVVHGFSLEDPSAAGADFLGVGPRHRTGAWHFAVPSDHTRVHVGGICLRLRTGKQVAP